MLLKEETKYLIAYFVIGGIIFLCIPPEWVYVVDGVETKEVLALEQVRLVFIKDMDSMPVHEISTHKKFPIDAIILSALLVALLAIIDPIKKIVLLRAYKKL